MRLRRLPKGLAAMVCLALLLTACGGEDQLSGGTQGGPTGSAPKGTLVIGSAGFTESQVMAEIYALLLQKAGYQTKIKTVANRELYEPALEEGQIDVVPDYAGTLTEFLNHKVNGPEAKPLASSDPGATVAALRKLAEPLGLTVLEPAEATDQNAFVVTKQFASDNKLTTLSDLGRYGRPLVLAATEECPDRPFCQPGLERTYGIEISKVEPLGFGTAQTKQAVVSGAAQLGLVGTTDGTLSTLGLVVLEDDKELQQAENFVPVVNTAKAGKADVAQALNALAPVLTTEDLTQLNLQVDAQRQKPADVAQEYLQSKNLL